MDVFAVWWQANDQVELGCRPCAERPEAWLLEVLTGPGGSVAVLDIRIDDGGSQVVWQSLAACAVVGSGAGTVDDPLEVLVTIPAAGEVAWEVHGLPGPVAIVGSARAQPTGAEQRAYAPEQPPVPQAPSVPASADAASGTPQHVPESAPADVAGAHDQALRLLWRATSAETPAARVALLAEALRWWPDNGSIQRRLAEAKRCAAVTAPPALTGLIKPVAGRPVRRRRSRGGRRTAWSSLGCWIACVILLLVILAILAVLAWQQMAAVMAPRAAQPQSPAGPGQTPEAAGVTRDRARSSCWWISTGRGRRSSPAICPA